jgi:DNA adenine methylase
MKTIVGRPGGKRRLKKEIVKRIPPHEKYVEPFFGGGSVFFSKNPSMKEIINDLDPSIAKVHKAVQRDNVCCDLKENRQKWENIKRKQQSGKKLTTCEQIYLHTASYGGTGQKYRGKPRKVPRKKVCFTKQHERLQNAKIRNEDGLKLIKKHDSPSTFFYIDPPYHQTGCQYPDKDKLCKIKPTELANTLNEIQGKFLLSYNNHPEVKNAFQGFKINPVETKYSFGKKSNKTKAKELLISNY